MYINPLTYFLGLIRFSTLGATFGPHKVSLVSPLASFGIVVGLTAILSLIGYWSWSHVRRVAVDYL